MATLKVSSRGQVTFSKELLLHLGVQPGEVIEITKQPDGKVTVQAVVDDANNLENAFGILASHNTKKIKLSIDEINAIAQSGWAGAKNAR